MNILIPNATSPKNIGDQAMLLSLLKLLRKQFPKAEIILQSIDPELQEKHSGLKTKHSLVSWILLKDKSFINRIIRLMKVLIQIQSKKGTFVSEYSQADLIVFVGNGYLRSRKKISQTVFLITLLLPYLLARSLKKRTVAAPMSFGPFAYDFEKNFVSSTLKNLGASFMREDISLAFAQSNGIQSGLLHDHGLLLPKITTKKSKKVSQIVVGLTVRNWLPEPLQRKFESEIIDGLQMFSLHKNIKVIPIVQVDAPEHNDRDKEVLHRMAKEIKLRNISVRNPIVLRSVQHAMEVYGSIEILVGMRMHSNIIAATQGVPFISIQYEYKTLGIAKSIGMEQYSLDCKQLRAKEMYVMLDSIQKNYKKIQTKLIQTLHKIQKEDEKKWFSEVKKVSYATI